MQHYETLFLVPGTYTEEEYPQIIKKIKDLIQKTGGQITHEKDLGRRKLAYTIKQNTHGYYYLVEMDLDSKELRPFDGTIKLMNEILRHQTVKKIKKTKEEIEKEKQQAEKRREYAEEKEKIEEKPIADEKPAIEEIPEKSDKLKEISRKEDEEKIKLEDLDKRLDEILDNENLV